MGLRKVLIGLMIVVERERRAIVRSNSSENAAVISGEKLRAAALVCAKPSTNDKV